MFDLSSTQEKYKSLNYENKSFNDRFSTLEDRMKEIINFLLNNDITCIWHHPYQVNVHWYFFADKKSNNISNSIYLQSFMQWLQGLNLTKIIMVINFLDIIGSLIRVLMQFVQGNWVLMSSNIFFILIFLSLENYLCCVKVYNRPSNQLILRFSSTIYLMCILELLLDFIISSI